MTRNKSTTTHVNNTVDFVALTILIETATRSRTSPRREATTDVAVQSPVAIGLNRATQSMSAREYVSARVTMAKLLGMVKQLRKSEIGG